MRTQEILLDDAQFAQALAVLDRERPSASERSWFLWLNLAVSSALALTVLWFVSVLATPGIQIVFLVAALVCYVSVVPMLLANLTLFRKLSRAALTEWRLGVSKNLSAFSSRRFMFFWLLPMPVGAASMYVAVGGILEELAREPNDWIGLLAAVMLFFFGVACLSLYPMERSKRRLDAVASLRAMIVERKLPPPAFEQITEIERTHIQISREDSIAAMRDRTGQPFALRFSPVFQKALAQRTPAELHLIIAALQGLFERTMSADADDAAAADLQSLSVVGTSLIIEFVRARGTGEIRAMSLHDNRQANAGAGNGPSHHEPRR